MKTGSIIQAISSYGAPSFHINERAVPLFVAVFGVYCLVAAHWKRFRARPGLVCILPALMSLDNLACGAGFGQVTDSVLFAQALALAATSLALAALGLYLGSFIRFAGARASEVAAGIALLAAGLVLSLV